MAVNTLLYDFTGVDTIVGSGVPVPSNYPSLTVVSGSWQRLGNRAFTDTDKVSSPILAVSIGLGDVDESISVSSGGGDALYARVTNSSNWVRARVRTWTISTYHAGSSGSYSGGGWVYSGARAASNINANQTLYGYGAGGIATAMAVFGAVGSYNVNNCTVADYTQIVTYTPGTASSYTYVDYSQIVLEKCVAGTVTILGTSANVTAPTSLRILAAGSSVKVYANGVGVPVLDLVEASFASIGRHGFGRGASDNDGQGLDNYSITYTSTPFSAFGIPL